MRALAVAAAIALLVLPGCSQSPSNVVAPLDLVESFGPATFDGETLRVEIPVPVVMLGFPASTVERVGKDLPPEEIVQQGYNHAMGFPPDLEGSSAEVYTKFPVYPTAHYQVHAAPAEMEAAFFAFAAQAKAPNGTMLDGNRVEAWLAEHLPMHGFALDPNTPTLVLLHGDGGLPSRHGWRYEYWNGYLDGIRSFGESKALLVFDTSANVDIYVGTEEDYFSPIESNDIAAIEHLVQDATNYRLLQAAIYPLSLAPCHAITFVMAVRAGALPEELVGRPPEDYLDVARLDGAFENLTGAGQVFADAKVLQLPQDDPGLDLFTRGGFNTVEEARWWVTENFANYWVPHEGCDAYVSIVVFGDTDQGGGIGMYDINKGQRIAISSDGALNRQMAQAPRTTLPTGGGIGGMTGRYSYEYPMLLFAHEAGHLIGQRHPHDIDQEDLYLSDSAFSSVYSVMSYQTGDRTVDFGTVDHANWWRNRLGFALQQASADGHSDGPEVRAALQHAQAYQWEQAYWDLAPLLPAGGPRA